MPQIVLDEKEVTNEWLPKVCISCGEEAVGSKIKTFRWNPPWAHALGPIGVWVTTQKMETCLPVCQKHTGPAPGMVLVLLILILGMIGLACYGAEENRQHPNSGQSLVGAGALGMIGSLTLLVFLYSFPIRATNITETQITLNRVCQTFIDEVERKRESEAENNTERYRKRLSY